MGNIRTKEIKKISFDLRSKHSDKFSDDFEKNKQALKEMDIVSEKIARNKIAGYITRIARHGKKVE